MSLSIVFNFASQGLVVKASREKVRVCMTMETFSILATSKLVKVEYLEGIEIF